MNVLIIEDDANKLRALQEFMLQYYRSTNCDCKMSFHSGMAALYSQSYDLLLLDMSMPIYDVTIQDTGGRPLPLDDLLLIWRCDLGRLFGGIWWMSWLRIFPSRSLTSFAESVFSKLLLTAGVLP